MAIADGAGEFARDQDIGKTEAENSQIVQLLIEMLGGQGEYPN